jgi:hypothetical protein
MISTRGIDRDIKNMRLEATPAQAVINSLLARCEKY